MYTDICISTHAHILLVLFSWRTLIQTVFKCDHDLDQIIVRTLHALKRMSEQHGSDQRGRGVGEN